MAEEVTSTIRVPVFDGQDKNFHSWWIKFQAYSRVKGFNAVLKDAGITIVEGDIKTLEAKPKHGSGDTGARTAEEEKQLKLGKKNLVAMAHLTMAFGSEALLNKIASACTTDWPGGMAHVLITQIKNKCAPQDRMAVAERTTKLNSTKLNKGEDPARLFEAIKAIDNQYKDLSHKLTEDDKIAIVLGKGKTEYSVILANTAREKGTSLTIDDLEEAMQIQWRISHGDENKNESNDSEFSLVASNELTCYFCGEKGHKANKCPKKKKNGGDGKGQNSGSNQNKKFNGKCHTCGKTGHKKESCWEDEANAHLRPSWWKPRRNNNEQGLAATNNSGNDGAEFLLMSVNEMEFNATAKILEDPNVFIGDTGASSDTTFSRIGFKNIKSANDGDHIKDASGNNISGKVVGDVSGTFFDKNGQELQSATIERMVHTPSAGYNLFSITQRLEHGWVLGGDKDSIWISKGGRKVIFDIKIKTPKGAIFCAYFKRKIDSEQEMAAAVTESKKTINADVAHGLLGHMNDADARMAAKNLGYELVKKGMTPCGACAEAKSKQRSLPSRTATIRVEVEPKQVVKMVNERVHLDISSVKNPQDIDVNVTKPHWMMVVDERTGMKWSEFHETKNGMVEPTCEKWYRWQQSGMPVKIVRCDNGGENKKLEKRSNSAMWKLDITFEYTARDTPQQNSLVEVGFTTIGNRARAMMIAANIVLPMRYRMYREAYTCATMLDWLVMVTLDGVTKSRVEHWCGELPKWAGRLRTWGEAGVVKVKTKTTPKQENRGITCMFVGYAMQHADGVYRMWYPVTAKIYTSRDVTWLRRMYYQRQMTALEITS